MRELDLYFMQLQEMWQASRHFFDSNSISDLGGNIQSSYTSTTETLEKLSTDATIVYRTSALIIHINFLKQLNQFIDYSLILLKSYSDVSSSPEITSNSTSSESNLENQYAECDHTKSLLCIVNQLLIALKEVQNETIVLENPLTGMNTANHDRDNDTLEFELKFTYIEVRVKAYELWMIIAQRNFTVNKISGVIMDLQKAKDISNNLLQKLEEVASAEKEEATEDPTMHETTTPGAEQIDLTSGKCSKVYCGIASPDAKE